MKTKYLQAALLLSCLTAIGTAQASLIVPGEGTVSLVPSSPTVGSGLAFTVDVVLDATGSGGDIPGAYDGEFVIDFDPLEIRYDTFVLAPGVSFFSGPTIGTLGGRQTVTIGFYDGAGSGSLGRFSFTALATPGTVAVIGLADADDFLGTFVSNQPSYQPFYPAFIGTDVGIIPLPAAGLLLGSALAGLGRRRRTRLAGIAT